MATPRPRSPKLGRRLRMIREGLGLSARQVAEQLGVNQGDICHLEKATRPSVVDLVPRVAEALGEDPIEFLALDAAEKGQLTVPVRSVEHARRVLRVAMGDK